MCDKLKPDVPTELYTTEAKASADQAQRERSSPDKPLKDLLAAQAKKDSKDTQKEGVANEDAE